MLGSARFGAVLLAAHLLAALLLGLGMRVLTPLPRPVERKPVPTEAFLRPSAALAGAVNAACRSMLYMCGFVVLFAALQALGDVTDLSRGLTRLIAWPLETAGADVRDLDCLVPILTEVTSGCVAASTTGELRPLLLGLALGWGGLSVHCQLTATLYEYNIMGRSFYLARLLHAALGGLLSVLLLRWIPVELPASAALSAGAPLATASVPAAVTLLAMCTLLLFTNEPPHQKNAEKSGFSY